MVSSPFQLRCPFSSPDDVGNWCLDRKGLRGEFDFAGCPSECVA